MRILVCGSRDFNNCYIVWGKLVDIARRCEITSIISGMARGPDSWAVYFAIRKNIPVEQFPAQWDLYGKRAGYVRNERMISTKPDLVLAFWNGSKGTKHTIDLAARYDIACEVIRE